MASDTAIHSIDLRLRTTISVSRIGSANAQSRTRRSKYQPAGLIPNADAFPWIKSIRTLSIGMEQRTPGDKVGYPEHTNWKKAAQYHRQPACAQVEASDPQRGDQESSNKLHTQHQTQTKAQADREEPPLRQVVLGQGSERKPNEKHGSRDGFCERPASEVDQFDQVAATSPAIKAWVGPVRCPIRYTAATALSDDNTSTNLATTKYPSGPPTRGSATLKMQLRRKGRTGDRIPALHSQDTTPYPKANRWPCSKS